MKSSVLTLLFLFLHSFSRGQLPVSVFKTLGTENTEEGKDIVFGDNGMIYVLSSTNATQGHSTDIMITALNSDLQCMWNKVYGWNYIEDPVALMYDNGALYVAGTFLSTFSLTYDVFVLKLDADGTEQWMQTTGGSDWDIAQNAGISDGIIHVMAEGMAENTNAHFIYRFDQNGNILDPVIPDLAGYTVVRSFEISENGYLLSVNSDVTEGSSECAILFLDAEGQLQQTIPVEVEGAGEVIIHDVEVKDDFVYYCGESHSPGRIDAMYRRMDMEGNVDISSIIDANGNSNYVAISVYDDRVVLPGYTMFAGAGGQDAFVMILTVDGFFQGAPTFGGDQDDYFSTAVFTEEKGVYAVGTGHSYNGETGETIVLKLSEATWGDYEQQFDLDNNCVIISVDEKDPEDDSVISIRYIDLLGREIDPENNFSLGEGMIFLEIQQMRSGEVRTQKRIWRSADFRN